MQLTKCLAVCRLAWKLVTSITDLPQSLLLLEVKVLIHLDLLAEAQDKLERINSATQLTEIRDQLRLLKALIYSKSNKVGVSKNKCATFKYADSSYGDIV